MFNAKGSLLENFSMIHAAHSINRQVRTTVKYVSIGIPITHKYLPLTGIDRYLLVLNVKVKIKMGQPRPLFVLFKHHYGTNTVDSSSVQTQVDGVEGMHADHNGHGHFSNHFALSLFCHILSRWKFSTLKSFSMYRTFQYSYFFDLAKIGFSKLN